MMPPKLHAIRSLFGISSSHLDSSEAAAAATSSNPTHVQRSCAMNKVGSQPVSELFHVLRRFKPLTGVIVG